MCAENNVMTGKNNMLVPIKDIMPIISVGYKNSPAHKTATSMLLGFTPVVGDIKDFQEAITGYDIVAGEKLTVASRGVTLVAAFIPIASGKSLRVTYDVAKIKSTKSLKALNKKFGVKIPSKLLDEGASGAIERINAENLKYSNSAWYDNRPYQKSPITIQNIIDSCSPGADPKGSAGLWWKVDGAFNGSQGTYELLISPDKTTIWHFLFRSK